MERPMGPARAIGCRCARGLSTGRFGPIGPQHSEKCQIVLLTREILSEGKSVKEVENRETQGSKITRKRLFEREPELKESFVGPNEGMPKRRADTRPEHQTWVRGKTRHSCRRVTLFHWADFKCTNMSLSMVDLTKCLFVSIWWSWCSLQYTDTAWASGSWARPA